MRPAAWAALACAVALMPGCKSGKQDFAHPLQLRGTVQKPDARRVTSGWVAGVDFVSANRGFVTTQEGALLETRNAGRTWVPLPRIRHLVDVDFTSARRGYAITANGTLLVTSDAGNSWRRIRRFAVSRYGLPTVSFVDAVHGWALSSGDVMYRTRDSGRTWRRLSGPCRVGDHLIGPSFVNEETGYVVCGGQPGAGSQPKALWVTRDGGDTWTLRSAVDFMHRPNPHRAMPAEGYAMRLDFQTPQLGLMSAARAGIFRTDTGGLTWKSVVTSDSLGDFAWPAARRLFVVTSAGLLRSDDGGRHWHRVFPRGFASPDNFYTFFSVRNGVAFGAPELLGNPQTILATRDGGRTWQRRGEIPLRGLVEQVFRFGRTVLATDQRTLLRSEDGGRHWKKLFALPSGSYGWFSFASETTGFVADDRHRLLRSDDGGSTWELVSSHTRELDRVVFVSPTDGFVVDYGPPPRDDGRKHPAPPARLLRSTDGGKSWTAVKSPLENVTHIYALDERHWWLFANAGCGLGKSCSSSQILRTADGGRHWDLIALPGEFASDPVSFVSPLVGFAGSPLSLYRTEDGGVTWKYVYAG
jgi:photosystem II stability/assembly factor-like uncharacterized protein